MAKYEPISIGQRFGRLLILSEVRKSPGHAHFTCQCDCGRITMGRDDHIRHGRKRSCGCLNEELKKARVKHGGVLGNPQEYRVWCGLRSRCLNSSNPAFSRYGGRGIKVCERWNDFANFLADMGPRPPGKSLDRINNDGDYEPRNCRWATAKEQSRNRRSNVVLEFRGERMIVSEWAERIGCTNEALFHRIARKQPVEKILRELL